MSELRYTEDHEWIRIEGDIGVVGVTNHAQEQLGDVVFVELPDVGQSFEKGDEAGTIESVKAASEIYAPASGEIVEVNEALTDEPATVNTDPFGAGWFYKFKIANKSELDGLMDEAAYLKHVGES